MGTATLTEVVFSSVKLCKFDWTSDGSGDVSQVTAQAYNGEIVIVVFVSDSGGTQPTDLYDVTLTDSNSGLDILCGNGANIDRTANQYVLPSSNLLPATGKLTLAVANAGASKGGEVYVYIR